MDGPVVKSYCSYVQNLDRSNVHRKYHDHEYGFPLHSDHDLFARLVLEINQAGLSWDTILKKKEHFYAAYDNFDVQTVAAYDDQKVERLLQDAGIIRNRLKIHAAIENARKILELQEQYGSFEQWLAHHHPLDKDDWVKLFKKHFRFTGGEIVNEFLMSTGYLKGAHTETCPIYKKIRKLNPMWLKGKQGK